MNRPKDLLSLTLLLFGGLVLITQPDPIEAGIMSYVPSLSSLNVFYWLSSANKKNSTTLTTGTNINRSDDFDNLNHFYNGTNSSTKTAGTTTLVPSSVTAATTVEKVTPIPTTIKSASSTISTSSPTSLTTTTTTTTPSPYVSTAAIIPPTGLIIALFTTQRPKISIENRHNRTLKVQIKKNGRIYETPLDANVSQPQNGSKPEQIFERA